ncbi:MAG: hypothetical protein Q8R78_04680, partial [Candidatus Omnitrophota bacterium]|nr:hypothetical protein [Candidatus Omnitrophota bacterium]
PFFLGLLIPHLTGNVGSSDLLLPGQRLRLMVKDAEGNPLVDATHPYPAFRWYRVEGRLGEGDGFSQVWKIVDLLTNETKALKIFRAQGIRGAIRNLQYGLAFQDRFAPQYYEEVPRQLLYNYRFLNLARRARGWEDIEIIPREGYAWVEAVGSWSILMPYRELSGPELATAPEPSQDYARIFAYMRRASDFMDAVGAGNLKPQVAISRNDPPWLGWFSVQNIPLDRQREALVIGDLERNLAALPFGAVFPIAFPVFIFGVFQDAYRLAVRRGVPPDAFHRMDMERFGAFLAAHPEIVLTSQEAGALAGWIAEYQELSHVFASRSPEWWRHGLDLRALLRALRTNNIYLWTGVYREVSRADAEVLAVSTRAYVAYALRRVLRRLPARAWDGGVALLRACRWGLDHCWEAATWLVRKAFKAARYLVDAKYRAQATDEFFVEDIDEAQAHHNLPASVAGMLRTLRANFAPFAVYAQLFGWILLFKVLGWVLRGFGGVEFVRSGDLLSGEGWDFIFLSFAVSALSRSLLTLGFARKHPTVDFTVAYWASLLPIIGGYTGLLMQMAASLRVVERWIAVKIKLFVIRLIKRVPGFGQPGGLGQHYGERYVSGPAIRGMLWWANHTSVIIIVSVVTSAAFFWMPTALSFGRLAPITLGIYLAIVALGIWHFYARPVARRVGEAARLFSYALAAFPRNHVWLTRLGIFLTMLLLAGSSSALGSWTGTDVAGGNGLLSQELIQHGLGAWHVILTACLVGVVASPDGPLTPHELGAFRRLGVDKRAPDLLARFARRSRAAFRRIARDAVLSTQALDFMLRERARRLIRGLWREGEWPVKEEQGIPITAIASVARKQFAWNAVDHESVRVNQFHSLHPDAERLVGPDRAAAGRLLLWDLLHTEPLRDIPGILREIISIRGNYFQHGHWTPQDEAFTNIVLGYLQASARDPASRQGIRTVLKLMVVLAIGSLLIAAVARGGLTWGDDTAIRIAALGAVGFVSHRGLFQRGQANAPRVYTLEPHTAVIHRWLEALQVRLPWGSGLIPSPVRMTIPSRLPTQAYNFLTRATAEQPFEVIEASASDDGTGPAVIRVQVEPKGIHLRNELRGWGFLLTSEQAQLFGSRLGIALREAHRHGWVARLNP